MTEQLAEKVPEGGETIPQRLKPGWFYSFTAQLKLCPFKAGEFFRKL
jgi:hypothetical protein